MEVSRLHKDTFSSDGVNDSFISRMKTYHIRVREEKVGYYSVKAESLNEAELKAWYKLKGETDGEVCPSIDYEEFDPKEFEE